MKTGFGRKRADPKAANFVKLGSTSFLESGALKIHEKNKDERCATLVFGKPRLHVKKRTAPEVFSEFRAGLQVASLQRGCGSQMLKPTGDVSFHA
jgi:hypothetical protein